MSFEVEVKYRVPSHAGLEGRLIALGGEGAPEVTQEDSYLNHPSRDFAQSNEALRLRRIGESNRITYKGPKHAGPTKTREEIEVPFAEGAGALDQMRRLFADLGFRPVAVIRKTRRTFHLKYRGMAVEVALDSAENLGDFVEVEAIAESAAGLPEAQAAVLDLARELGLTDVEPRSYLRMALEKTRG